jgi:hypothetical protein
MIIGYYGLWENGEVANENVRNSKNDMFVNLSNNFKRHKRARILVKVKKSRW